MRASCIATAAAAAARIAIKPLGKLPRTCHHKIRVQEARAIAAGSWRASGECRW